jgi:hypothetical protein
MVARNKHYSKLRNRTESVIFDPDPIALNTCSTLILTKDQFSVVMVRPEFPLTCDERTWDSGALDLVCRARRVLV